MFKIVLVIIFSICELHAVTNQTVLDSIKTVYGYCTEEYIHQNSSYVKSGKSYVTISYPFESDRNENFYFPQYMEKIKKAKENYYNNRDEFFETSDTIKVDSLLNSFKYYFVTFNGKHIIEPLMVRISLFLNGDFSPVEFGKTVVFKYNSKLPERDDGFVFISKMSLEIKNLKYINFQSISDSEFFNVHANDTMLKISEDQFKCKYLFNNGRLVFTTKEDTVLNCKASVFDVNGINLLMMNFDNSMCTFRRLFNYQNKILLLKDFDHQCDP